MNLDKPWLRMSLVAAGVLVAVGAVRLGRLHGKASGGLTQAGCGGFVDDPSEPEPVVVKDGLVQRPVLGRANPALRNVPFQKGRVHTDRGDIDVHYQVLGDHAVVEGDMLFPLAAVQSGDGQASGAATSSSSSRWPSGILYYTLDSSLDSTEQSWVSSAISHWTKYTNIQFVSGTGSGAYVTFKDFGDGACQSSVGRTGGQQYIHLTHTKTSTYESGCFTGATIHEIGHALGLYHEQSRLDRDSYVTINWSNIESGYASNFYTMSSSSGMNVGSYDYGSIMHYGAYDFSSNGQKTITVLQSGVSIGQRDGLSDTDIDSIESMYNGVLELYADTQWYGTSNAGAGIALGSIDTDSRPDAVIFHVDNPSGENTGYYRIAWNIDSATLTNNTATTYRPSKTEGPVAISGWWGSTTVGAGAAIGDIDGNGRPDLVLVWIDDPGTCATYYRIGWNLGYGGAVSSWSGPFSFTGGKHGSSTQGADVALKDLNGNGKLDLVVGSVDDPSGENTFYYAVGWDLSSSGAISSYSSTYSMPDQYVGATTAGVGLDVADMDGNGTSDLVVSWVDAPSGDDVHYYRVGYDISSSTGQVGAGWSEVRTISSRLGENTEGADLAVYDFDGNGSNDLFAFHLDPAGSGDTGYTYVDMDQSDKVYKLQIKCSSQCMDAENNGTANGTAIQQYTCNGTSAQKFTLAKTDDGYYTLVGKTSGKCVDVTNNGTTNGTAIQLYTCNNTDAQKFSLVSNGAGYYSIKGKGSGKCLDMYNYSTTAGTNFQLFTCTGVDAQLFTLTQITN